MSLLGWKPILGMGLPFLPVPSLPESLFTSSQLLIYYHRSYITEKARTAGLMPRVSAIRTALLLRASSAVDALWWALVWVALCLLPGVLPCASPPGLFPSDLLIFSDPCLIRPSTASQGSVYPYVRSLFPPHRVHDKVSSLKLCPWGGFSVPLFSGCHPQ